MERNNNGQTEPARGRRIIMRVGRSCLSKTRARLTWWRAVQSSAIKNVHTKKEKWLKLKANLQSGFKCEQSGGFYSDQMKNTFSVCEPFKDEHLTLN